MSILATNCVHWFFRDFIAKGNNTFAGMVELFAVMPQSPTLSYHFLPPICLSSRVSEIIVGMIHTDKNKVMSIRAILSTQEPLNYLGLMIGIWASPGLDCSTFFMGKLCTFVTLGSTRPGV